MPTTRADFAKAMVDDGYGYAMEAYDAEDTVYDQLFDVEDSAGAYEQWTTAIGPGKLTETEEGVSINRVEAREGFTTYCRARKFADELPITNEAIDDNRKIDNFLKEWATANGEAARQTKEQHHADIFNYGGYTAGHRVFNQDIPGGILTTGHGSLGYDNVEFFNLSSNLRTAKHGGTYYNAKAVLPMNETNLQVLWQLITVTNHFNEAGNKVSIVPTVILTQLGSDNWFTARRIVESIGASDGQHSGVKNLWRNLHVIGWPFLDQADTWFLGKPKAGLKSLNRTPLKMDTYEDKRIDAQVIRIRIRFGANFTNFRYWAAANITTS